ncbi:MAG: ogr/Delta-like zinc finger family protein [Treponema sp.]|nr:ogr/Delta-like zinc finger family protein [Treponema sp.]
MTMRKSSIFKIAGVLLLVFITCLAIFSCARDSVTYCPFCGQAGIREISTYDTATGQTIITYQCTNSECGKKFGAGIVP